MSCLVFVFLLVLSCLGGLLLFCLVLSCLVASHLLSSRLVSCLVFSGLVLLCFFSSSMSVYLSLINSRYALCLPSSLYRRAFVVLLPLSSSIVLDLSFDSAFSHVFLVSHDLIVSQSLFCSQTKRWRPPSWSTSKPQPTCPPCLLSSLWPVSKTP